MPASLSRLETPFGAASDQWVQFGSSGTPKRQRYSSSFCFKATGSGTRACVIAGQLWSSYSASLGLFSALSGTDCTVLGPELLWGKMDGPWELFTRCGVILPSSLSRVSYLRYNGCDVFRACPGLGPTENQPCCQSAFTASWPGCLG